MKIKKRTKRIEIAVNEEEYKALLARKTKARLAEWLRELALGQVPKPTAKTIDPALLFELNRIGVNLNQIARQCNQKNANIQLVSILTTLQSIDRNLTLIRENI